jgi:hypothetical protein
MDEETRRVLDETRALVKDNHRMLRAIRRGQFVSMVTRIIIWVVVLALPLYLYQEYLAPTIAKISEISGVPTSTAEGLFGIPSSAQIGEMLDSVRSGQ